MPFRNKDDDRERVDLLGRWMSLINRFVYDQIPMEEFLDQDSALFDELRNLPKFELIKKDDPMKINIPSVGSCNYQLSDCYTPTQTASKSWFGTYSLAPLDTCTSCTNTLSYGCKSSREEGNNPMNTHDTIPHEKKYLLDRLYNVERPNLRAMFGLEDDERPTTPKEIVDRILAGKYVLPKTDDDFDRDYADFSDSMWAIRWRDPNKVEDKEGYKAAHEARSDAYNATKDQIMISSPEAGLAALQAFEKWTPNGVAN